MSGRKDKILQSRSHYPLELQRSEIAPYLVVSRRARGRRESSTLFHYRISYSFRRKHFNPPIWLDAHEHEFEVRLHLQAVRSPSSLYGLDMVEVESLLKFFAEALPEVVNDHPAMPGGTTEEMCEYFAAIELDPHIQVLQVDVSEVSQRVTSFKPFSSSFGD